MDAPEVRSDHASFRLVLSAEPEPYAPWRMLISLFGTAASGGVNHNRQGRELFQLRRTVDFYIFARALPAPARSAKMSGGRSRSSGFSDSRGARG